MVLVSWCLGFCVLVSDRRTHASVRNPGYSSVIPSSTRQPTFLGSGFSELRRLRVARTRERATRSAMTLGLQRTGLATLSESSLAFVNANARFRPRPLPLRNQLQPIIIHGPSIESSGTTVSVGTAAVQGYSQTSSRSTAARGDGFGDADTLAACVGPGGSRRALYLLRNMRRR